jgi:hypothetical protein
MTMQLRVVTSGLNSNHFWACNSPRASTCLPEKPWYGLWPALELLKSTLLSSLAMRDDHRSNNLDGASKRRLRSVLWNQRFGSLCDSELWGFEISNLASFVLQSPGADDPWTPVLTINGSTSSLGG